MTTALKDDKEKPDLSLLPRVFKEAVARVMMFGARKYGRWNYTNGHEISRLVAAAERHLDAIKDGEDTAADSGESHWSHVAANALMALHQIQLGTIKDDRFTKVTVAPSIKPAVLNTWDLDRLAKLAATGIDSNTNYSECQAGRSCYCNSCNKLRDRFGDRD